MLMAAYWVPSRARVIDKRAAFYIANETMCIVDGEVYRRGDPVPTVDHCERCTCRPPGFSCVLRECETKPDCKSVRRDGECCPDYVCGCLHNNRLYNDGEIIDALQNACYTCRCHGSSISCTFADCLFRGDCPPEYVDGECCPRYEHCPPLSTRPPSTIFTTPAPTQPTIIQQEEEEFLNHTIHHVGKFTTTPSSITIQDVVTKSPLTTTTSPLDTTTLHSVTFTFIDGQPSSLDDFDIATLTTLLPVTTVSYTETTKHVFPDGTTSVTTPSYGDTSTKGDEPVHEEVDLNTVETGLSPAVLESSTRSPELPLDYDEPKIVFDEPRSTVPTTVTSGVTEPAYNTITSTVASHTFDKDENETESTNSTQVNLKHTPTVVPATATPEEPVSFPETTVTTDNVYKDITSTSSPSLLDIDQNATVSHNASLFDLKDAPSSVSTTVTTEKPILHLDITETVYKNFSSTDSPNSFGIDENVSESTDAPLFEFTDTTSHPQQTDFDVVTDKKFNTSLYDTDVSLSTVTPSRVPTIVTEKFPTSLDGVSEDSATSEEDEPTFAEDDTLGTNSSTTNFSETPDKNTNFDVVSTVLPEETVSVLVSTNKTSELSEDTTTESSTFNKETNPEFVSTDITILSTEKPDLTPVSVEINFMGTNNDTDLAQEETQFIENLTTTKTDSTTADENKSEEKHFGTQTPTSVSIDLSSEKAASTSQDMEIKSTDLTTEAHEIKNLSALDGNKENHDIANFTESITGTFEETMPEENETTKTEIINSGNVFDLPNNFVNDSYFSVPESDEDTLKNNQSAISTSDEITTENVVHFLQGNETIADEILFPETSTEKLGTPAPEIANEQDMEPIFPEDNKEISLHENATDTISTVTVFPLMPNRTIEGETFVANNDSQDAENDLTDYSYGATNDSYESYTAKQGSTSFPVIDPSSASSVGYDSNITSDASVPEENIDKVFASEASVSTLPATLNQPVSSTPEDLVTDNTSTGFEQNPDGGDEHNETPKLPIFDTDSYEVDSNNINNHHSAWKPSEQESNVMNSSSKLPEIFHEDVYKDPELEVSNNVNATEINFGETNINFNQTEINSTNYNTTATSNQSHSVNHNIESLFNEHSLEDNPNTILSKTTESEAGKVSDTSASTEKEDQLDVLEGSTNSQEIGVNIVNDKIHRITDHSTDKDATHSHSTSSDSHYNHPSSTEVSLQTTMQTNIMEEGDEHYDLQTHENKISMSTSDDGIGTFSTKNDENKAQYEDEANMHATYSPFSITEDYSPTFSSLDDLKIAESSNDMKFDSIPLTSQSEDYELKPTISIATNELINRNDNNHTTENSNDIKASTEVSDETSVNFDDDQKQIQAIKNSDPMKVAEEHFSIVNSSTDADMDILDSEEILPGELENKTESQDESDSENVTSLYENSYFTPVPENYSTSSDIEEVLTTISKIEDSESKVSLETNKGTTDVDEEYFNSESESQETDAVHDTTLTDHLPHSDELPSSSPTPFISEISETGTQASDKDRESYPTSQDSYGAHKASTEETTTEKPSSSTVHIEILFGKVSNNIVDFGESASAQHSDSGLKTEDIISSVSSEIEPPTIQNYLSGEDTKEILRNETTLNYDTVSTEKAVMMHTKPNSMSVDVSSPKISSSESETTTHNPDTTEVLSSEIDVSHEPEDISISETTEDEIKYSHMQQPMGSELESVSDTELKYPITNETLVIDSTEETNPIDYEIMSAEDDTEEQQKTLNMTPKSVQSLSLKIKDPDSLSEAIKPLNTPIAIKSTEEVMSENPSITNLSHSTSTSNPLAENEEAGLISEEAIRHDSQLNVTSDTEEAHYETESTEEAKERPTSAYGTDSSFSISTQSPFLENEKLDAHTVKKSEHLGTESAISSSEVSSHRTSIAIDGISKLPTSSTETKLTTTSSGNNLSENKAPAAFEEQLGFTNAENKEHSAISLDQTSNTDMFHTESTKSFTSADKNTASEEENFYFHDSVGDKKDMTQSESIKFPVSDILGHEHSVMHEVPRTDISADKAGDLDDSNFFSKDQIPTAENQQIAASENVQEIQEETRNRRSTTESTEEENLEKSDTYLSESTYLGHGNLGGIFITGRSKYNASSLNKETGDSVKENTASEYSHGTNITEIEKTSFHINSDAELMTENPSETDSSRTESFVEHQTSSEPQQVTTISVPSTTKSDSQMDKENFKNDKIDLPSENDKKENLTPSNNSEHVDENEKGKEFAKGTSVDSEEAKEGNMESNLSAEAPDKSYDYSDGRVLSDGYLDISNLGEDYSVSEDTFLPKTETTVHSDRDESETPTQSATPLPVLVQNFRKNSSLDESNELEINSPEAESKSRLVNAPDATLANNKDRPYILHPYSLSEIVSNVFKAPGYDSEVDAHLLKEKNGRVHRVKRTADLQTANKNNNEQMIDTQPAILVEGFGGKPNSYFPVTSSFIVVHDESENEADNEKHQSPAIDSRYAALQLGDGSTVTLKRGIFPSKSETTPSN
ncbi:mucin-3A-like [Uloborus diversus]|uniref:mucin-3A-like n=1 Tax=Uloborus diversus TaxID=327109 RepID=UPI00240A59C8|nr:mucin-3A-like [Uloborus diversus]